MPVVMVDLYFPELDTDYVISDNFRSSLYLSKNKAFNRGFMWGKAKKQKLRLTGE